MNIEITLQPLFWLALFRRDVEALLKLSEHHYDGGCRRVGKQGGFLYGWSNMTSNQSPHCDYKIEDVSKCSGSRRDLDTVLKICEGSRMACLSKVITLEERERVDQLCALILTAMEQATQRINERPIIVVDTPSSRGSLMWATSPGRH